jgi:hypothetical protein
MILFYATINNRICFLTIPEFDLAMGYPLEMNLENFESVSSGTLKIKKIEKPNNLKFWGQ